MAKHPTRHQSEDEGGFTDQQSSAIEQNAGYAPEPETPPTTVFDPKTGAHRAPLEGEKIRHGRVVHADYKDEGAPPEEPAGHTS